MDPATGALDADVPYLIDGVRAFGLVVVLITVCLVKPRPGLTDSLGIAITVALSVSAVAWIAWMVTVNRPRLLTASLVVMGASGGVLAGLSQNSPAVAIGCAAACGAAVRLRTEVSVGIVAETMAAFLV